MTEKVHEITDAPKQPRFDKKTVVLCATGLAAVVGGYVLLVKKANESSAPETTESETPSN